MAAPVKTGASILHSTVVRPNGAHLASVIFLHGSGDTGEGVQSWIRSLLTRDLEIPNTKLIFPTAPLRPYSPMNGALSNVWFDREKIAPTAPECLDSINSACEEIGKIIKAETESGIAKNKIVIGGFSMGGGLAYHLAYRFHRNVAGVFSLSGFINKSSIVYEEVRKVKNGLPPLFAAHGGKDPLVLFDWGVEAVETLRSLGVQTVFHEFPRLYHELGVQELRLLEAWLSEVLFG